MKQFFKSYLNMFITSTQYWETFYIENTDKTSEKSQKIFSHILNAHQISNNRIKPKHQILKFGQFIRFKIVSKLTK